MALIWCCPTCRVGVRVPDDAPRSRIIFRCPRCRAALSFTDPPPAPPGEEIEDVEAVEEIVPELEPAEPAPRWYGQPPPPRVPAPTRREYDEYDNRPPRRPRRRRERAGAPWWVWLIVAGVGLLSLGLVAGITVALWPASPSNSSAGQPPGPGSAAEPKVAADPRINFRNTDQLRVGMSQAEVERILGGPGTVISRETVGLPPDRVEGKWVRWEDGRGGSLQVRFEDDKLVTMLAVD